MSPSVFRPALALLVASAFSVRGEVVFSEIHYHPVEKAAFNADGSPVLDLTDDVHEFIELHNSGNAPVALEGWTLTGGVNYTFPAASEIPAGAFWVIAGAPERVATLYGLPAESVLGPWTGHLSNRREKLELSDPEGNVQDALEYRAESPWPISADALGADDEWTGLKSEAYQYRGRSLERVSFTHPSSDPANWLASPLASGPSPGKPNAVSLDVPHPVVLAHDIRQADDGATVLRSGRPVRVECVFTSGEGVRNVRLEWFREDLNVAVKPVTIQPMWSVGSGLDARFQTEVPGQGDRSIIRYRIRADRGDGDQVVSPRADDPFAWHAWFVSPARTTTASQIYDLLISRASLTILRTNITSEPRRVTRPDPPGLPRASWNATQPALFVHEGKVYDVRMRHHGSQFRRDVNRKSYKVQFPAYARFEGRESVFLTDKDQRTVAGHTLFRAAGLPTSRVWWCDLYVNTDARLRRLAQEEYDGFLLERHQAEEAAARAEGARETGGEFYKSQGIFDEPTGPYGNGNGVLLRARVSGGKTVWTPLQRYEWTYTLQMNGWKGHREFGVMLTNHWKARNNSVALPTSAVTNKLRTYFEGSWDVEKSLRHIALVNWQGVWDDTMHNYYLWQQGNGRWAMLPWDFDDQFDGQPNSVSIFNGAPFAGPNYLKQSLVAAFRDEFQTRAWWLNNTLLDPENLASLGVSAPIRTWSVGRQRSVNTQLKLGFFSRPLRPTNSFPTDGATVSPGNFLIPTAYRYNTNPIIAHAATVWQIRETNRTWLEPLLTVTNATSLTSHPLAIGPLTLGHTYAWRVQQVDSMGHPSTWSAETRFHFGAATDSPVVMNEVLAVNTGSVRNGGDRPDYVELVNRDGAPVNLGGWSVTDNLEQPSRYVIPEGTHIPGHGHLVLWCDSRNNSPGLHTGFGLKREGETMGLFAPGPTGLQLMDWLTFGPQLPDLAVGRRTPDGSWTLVLPSPLAVNSPVELDDPGTVRINEWLATAAGSSDWLELFHPGARPVDLGGLILSDTVDDSPLPPLSFIGAHGFLQGIADGFPDAAGDHLNFRLSGNGGAIVLRRPDGRLVDRVFYPRQERGISQGRVPDGADNVYPLPRISPAASNSTDTDFDGLPDAWEIAFHLNPLVADSMEDSDYDGWLNGDEFRLGLSPQDPASRLELILLSSSEPGQPDSLGFEATPGHRYTLEKYSSETTGWQPLRVFPPGQTLHAVHVPLVLEAGDPGGLFRVTVE